MDELTELRGAADLQPPIERSLPRERLAERKAALTREIVRHRTVGRPDPVGRRRRTRRRVVAIVLVPAALLGGAIAWSATANRTAGQVGNFVTCFDAPKLDAGAFGTSLTPGHDLASFCDSAWNSGAITSPVPGPAPAQWVACVADTDGVDVFPSADGGLCQALGLQPIPPGYYEAEQRYSSMEADLFARFGDGSCVASQQAVVTTRQVLDAHGYPAWTIETQGFGPGDPCASIGLDPVNGVATLRGRIEPRLSEAVQQGLQQANSCGPEQTLLGDVREAIAAAGFADWQVTIDHPLTDRWPCVAGFDPDPATKTIVLTGHATG